MVLLTVILVLVALFVIFLMLTSGHHKKKLQKALQNLKTERMKLLKSIEHVKLSYYQKRLGDKEAQDKIFEYEEKLRQVEARILELEEKPLMRTLNKQEAAEAKAKDLVSKERVEVEQSQGFMLGNMEAKMVVGLFIVVVLAVVIAMGIMGRTTSGSEPYKGTTEVPLSARVVPLDAVPPGSTAGLRVEIRNPHDFPLRNVYVMAKAPERSGIRFEEGEVEAKKITELESGGVRDIYFTINVDQTTEDGEYVLEIEAVNEDGLKSSTDARLTVRFGAEEKNV